VLPEALLLAETESDGRDTALVPLMMLCRGVPLELFRFAATARGVSALFAALLPQAGFFCCDAWRKFRGV